MQSSLVHPNCIDSEESSPISSNSGKFAGVAAPSEKDVLCGRGTSIQKHCGNLTFRELISRNKKTYFDSKRSDKLKVAKSIVKTIKDNGGRFLERDGSSGLWIEVSSKKAVEKACQALREGQPSQSKRSLVGNLMKGRRSSSSSITKNGIKTPGENDVLCGRGSFQKHIGNRRFREIVAQKKVVYATSKKSDKVKISKAIVDIVRNRGGRFLERDNGSGLWFEVSERKALEKTSQTLREGQPSLLRSLISSDGTLRTPDEVPSDDFVIPNKSLSIPETTLRREVTCDDDDQLAPMAKHESRSTNANADNSAVMNDFDPYDWRPEPAVSSEIALSSEPAVSEETTFISGMGETPLRRYVTEEHKEETKEEAQDFDYPEVDLEPENVFFVAGKQAPLSRRCSPRRSHLSSARSSMLSRLSLLSGMSELDVVLTELAMDVSTGRSSIRSSIKIVNPVDERDIQTIFETPHQTEYTTDCPSLHKPYKNSSPRHSVRSSIKSSMRSSLRSSMMSLCSQALVDIRSLEAIEMDDLSVLLDDGTRGLASVGDISKTQSWDSPVPYENYDIQGKQYEEAMRNISGVLLQSFGVASNGSRESQSLLRSSLAQQTESLVPPGFVVKEDGTVGVPNEIVIQ